jgi:iron-sulfur cluster assembly accessory protein
MTLLDQTQINQVMLTTSAAAAVQELLSKRDLPDYALRVYISGGGCSGFQYGMALDGDIRDTDLLFEEHGVKLVVDEVSINYLRGATIDFVDELMGRGFKIENPNAISTCGCGNSFRTKDSEAASEGESCNCH